MSGFKGYESYDFVVLAPCSARARTHACIEVEIEKTRNFRNFRNWRVNKRRKVATTKLGGYAYQVDLSGLDHAEAFDWMAHLSGKSWMTTDALFEIGEILRVWIKQEDGQ